MMTTTGEFCKSYRKNVLRMSLKEVSELTGVKTTTLSSFENGKSTNLTHINTYLMLSNENEATYFRMNIPYII